ncbi:phospholipase D-like domain-containing protein [Aurantimonas sp. HBX-1]|uniref:phospholipase D-like domain-containing protein n=1 Tax=Aurantimonas sp. HBX-1 TaxID=2906072 RepID=UPI001F1B4683|nr:phospholipase D-like domain-containing protein [Aurantimonas sp. HBX-1]UIJ73327.1 phospholipase D-like domain-containing protein [Aurantimonas sp. HBX-1]
MQATPASRKSGRSPILRAGENCWRIETADRVAWLVDGEEYHPTAKQALLNARHSVLLVGWDFAPDARLEPRRSDTPTPDRIGDLLEFIARRRPELDVRVLIWDKAVLLDVMRRRPPGLQETRMKQGPVNYVLDRAHPFLASGHQKLMVIDDRLAFCGGFDFGGNRWDTNRHQPQDLDRQTPAGQPAKPHHDVMLMVDGDAAAALGDLARERWRRATGTALEARRAEVDPWPKAIEPQIRQARVGIARTAGAWHDHPEIREVERLYLDAIAAARDCIYLESQYLASYEIGDALARRLQEPDGPEVIVVTPKRSPALLEHLAMDSARTRIAADLRRSDRFDRFRLYASLTDGKEVVVHSKVMVVDDQMLRVGSANLNRRSMGTDFECDLAVEAGPQDEQTRRAILRFRGRLVADHLGLQPAEVERISAEGTSLIGTIEHLNGRTNRSLSSFPEPRPGLRETIMHQSLTDPRHPLLSRPPIRSSILRAAVAGAVGLGAALLLRRLARAKRTAGSRSEPFR